jgi:hypothetical protein
MNRLAIFQASLAVLALACDVADDVEPTESPGEPALSNDGGANAVLPGDPDFFRIELSSGPCLGDCPTYSMSIDSDGAVSFVGERCLLRPGVSEKQVSPEDARAVYDELMATDFRTLGDRYLDEEHGCMLATDQPTTLWKVFADGKKKSLKHYRGCAGVEGLDEVDAVRQHMHRRADVLEELKTHARCDDESNRIPETSFRLSRAGVALGVLQIKTMYEAPRYFELRDCAGELLALGDARTERGRVVLLEADRGRITLPAELGEAASLLLEFGETTADAFREPVLPTSGRALRVEARGSAREQNDDEDVEFELTVATSCE